MVTHFRLRLYMLALLIMLGFGVLVARLYRVQIRQHDMHVQRLPGERFESVRIPGVRGEIKDRNGITLAENIAKFEMRFDLKAIVEDYRSKHKGKFPKRTIQVYKKGQPEDREEIDIDKIVKQTVLGLDRDPTEEDMPSLRRLGLLDDYNTNQLRVHYRSTGGVVPFTYRRNLKFDDLAKFAEHNLGLPGVTVTESGQRHYVYDALASHVLGYINLPDIDQVPLEKRREFNYYVGDDYGVHGVEKTMDHYLQGVPGKRVLVKDEKGKFVRDESFTPPEEGADVYLTIDARIQMIAEESLRKIGRGAAVVMDPQTGDVLAMASVPSFNPNAFIPQITVEEYERYNKDKTSPIFNRAINPYSPGSTFKIPVALAGCLSDSWKRRFVCGSGAQYGNKFMKCWCAGKGYTHGSPTLSEGIKYSCNGFFYRYANDTGIRNIQTMTGLLGLGRTTGIKITGEQPGTIPGPEWLRMKGLRWSDAYTAMTAIGQGFAEATPLQMASATCTVANGGLVYQPRLISKVIRKNGEIVQEPPNLRHDLTKEGLTAEQIETVKRGMWRVVNDSGGTAGRAASKITVISGKTGTTQTGNPNQPNNAWFIAFAPYDDPELAVCVFVENGKSGGGAASPIAKNIIDHTMAMRQGHEEVPLEELTEASGHFDRIESVSFEGEGAVVVSSDDDADSAVDVGDFVPAGMRQVRPMSSGFAKPSIRSNADREGSVSSQNAKSERKFRPLKWLGIRR